jgi:cell division septum initiation protein DivIVA
MRVRTPSFFYSHTVMSAPAPAPIATATATAAESSVDSIVCKVQKHLDQLKAKNTKLAEDNAKLKAQLAEARSSHSRIRRIPKKKAGEE